MVERNRTSIHHDRKSIHTARGRVMRFEQFENRIPLAADAIWQNSFNALDVNGDGQFLPSDILAVVDEINRHGIRELPEVDDVAYSVEKVPQDFADVNGDGLLSPADVLVLIDRINGSPAALPQLEVTDAVGREGEVTVFYVTRTSNVDDYLFAQIEIGHGSTSDSDFAPIISTTIPTVFLMLPGERMKSIVLPLSSADSREPNETFQLRLVDPYSGTIASAAGTIIDFDSAFVSVLANWSGVEASTATATLRNHTPGPIDVSYFTESATAQANVDFIPVSGTVRLAPGESIPLEIELIDDGEDEDLEWFFVRLTDLQGNPIGLDRSEVYVSDNDPGPGFSTNVETLTVLEGTGGDTLVRVTVTADRELSFARLVNYTFSGSPAQGQAFDTLAGNATGNLIMHSGERSKSFVLIVKPNIYFEPDWQLPIRFSVWSFGYNDRFDMDSTLTIRNDDPAPPIDLLIDDVAGVEGATVNQEFVFPITLSAAVDYPVYATVSVVDGSASFRTGYRDYGVEPLPATSTYSSLQLTFAPGETSKSISVPINSDDLIELDETFSVRLTNVLGAVVVRELATGTIVNDDLPTVEFRQKWWGDREGDAGTSTATIFAELNGRISHPVTVHYETVFDTAGVDDFIPASGTLTIHPGQAYGEINVTVMGDLLTESESFLLRLSQPTNALLVNSEVRVDIYDDDQWNLTVTGPPSVDERDFGSQTVYFEVQLQKALANVVTTEFATDGATPGNDYTETFGTLTFAPGETVKLIAVEVHGDELLEPDEYLSVRLITPVMKSATVIIRDDDRPTLSISNAQAIDRQRSNSMMTFNFSLSKPMDVEVSSEYYFANGTAISGSDYLGVPGTMVFTPGETVKSLSVVVLADNLQEGGETFRLYSRPSTTIRVPETHSVGSIFDPQGLPMLSVEPAEIVEGRRNSQFVRVPVMLHAPSAETVTVSFTTQDLTASAADGDYRPTSGTITFAPGEIDRWIDIEVFGDNRVETDETFQVLLSNAVAADIRYGSVAQVAIRNDD